VQELKNVMARLWEDNARLTMEHERIIKSLSDKKNQQPLNPSAEKQRCQGNIINAQNPKSQKEGRRNDLIMPLNNIHKKGNE